MIDEIIAAYTAVLPDGRIDPTAAFADLGGTSLKAAMILARLWREFGVRLPLTELSGRVTAEGLATRLAEHTRDTTVFWPRDEQAGER